MINIHKGMIKNKIINVPTYNLNLTEVISVITNSFVLYMARYQFYSLTYYIFSQRLLLDHQIVVAIN